jgi:hypothetical protein
MVLPLRRNICNLSLREYVAAYGSNGQRVCEESRDGRLDTWSTLNSQNNAVTWMGLQGLRKHTVHTCLLLPPSML